MHFIKISFDNKAELSYYQYIITFLKINYKERRKDKMKYQAEYKYTIDDISSKCQKTKQSIYNLIRKDKEFIKNNSIKRGRKVLYNTSVLNRCLLYYGIESVKDNSIVSSEATPAPPESNKELMERITMLESEIDGLKERLEVSETERKDLLQQNGALILTLQQEKQEKMLLLPGPRKGMFEKIKEWFHK